LGVTTLSRMDLGAQPPLPWCGRGAMRLESGKDPA